MFCLVKCALYLPSVIRATGAVGFTRILVIRSDSGQTEDKSKNNLAELFDLYEIGHYLSRSVPLMASLFLHSLHFALVQLVERI